MDPIPFNRVSLTGNELSYMAAALEIGKISGDGQFTRRAETILERIGNNARVLLTTSCTHALELVARVLRLGPGDEVIVPAYTFTSTAAAFALTGARPIFVDVDPYTLNLDVGAVEAALSSQTRAICTVHYAGIAQDVDKLQSLCINHDVALIEDNAHGFGGAYKGRLLGTYGQMSTLSFHETKNVTCGEGGAIAINNQELEPLVEILREKGTNRSRFLRGQVDKYTWMEVGSSWLLADLLAAFLVGQLENFEDTQAKRMQKWNHYDSSLADWATETGVLRPHVPAEAEHPAHMYFLRMQDLSSRTAFISHLRRYQVDAVFHYQALNASPAGSLFGASRGDCPVAERAADTLVRLPLHRTLSQDEQDHIIDSVLRFS